MEQKSLRRFGVAGLGAVIALASPAFGLTGIAHADSNQSAEISFTTPIMGDDGSLLSDGTNNAIKLEVVQSTNPGGAGNPAIGQVVFSYAATTGTDQTSHVIGTPVTAPYEVQWKTLANGSAIPNGTYTISAEPETSSGASAGDVITETVTVDNTDPTVNVTSPADGDTTNYFQQYNNTDSQFDGTSYIHATGTRSLSGGDLPEIDAYTELRDLTNTNADNQVGTKSATVTVASAVTGAAANASQTWGGGVPLPTATCPSGDTCDLVVHAIAGGSTPGAGNTDDSTVSTLGTSVPLGSGSVTPSGNETIATTASETYTVKAVAPDGTTPVPGLLISASASGANAVIVPTDTDADNGSGTNSATERTDKNGEATFVISDSTAETSTLTFQSEANGTSYTNGIDFRFNTQKLITETAVLGGVSLTANPNLPTYASQAYNVSADSNSFPVVTACLTDQNGNPITLTGADAGSANQVTATDTRTITSPSGDAGTTTPVAKLSTTAQTVSGNPDCYQVSLDPATVPSDATGSDTITVYQNNDNTGGFQKGGLDVGDVLTLNFAPGVISFDNYKDCTNADCRTQAQIGTVDTITVHDNVGSGQPLTLTIGGSGTAIFPSSQPSDGGTTVTVGSNGKTATCTTDSTGSCQVNVSDSTAESNVPLTATSGSGDNTLTGTIDINFRTESVKLDTAERGSHGTLYPNTDGTTDAEDYGTPGTVMVDAYHLYDSAGNALDDVPVTVTIDHGYFTDVPSDVSFSGDDGDDEIEGDYNSSTFAPAAAAGGTAGTFADIGTAAAGGGETLSGLYTNNHGVVVFATSIGRDTGFDNNGEVLTTVGISSNGATASLDHTNPAGTIGTGSDESYTWTTNSTDQVGYYDGDDGGFEDYDCADEVDATKNVRADDADDCFVEDGYDEDCSEIPGAVFVSDDPDYCRVPDDDAAVTLGDEVPGGALNADSSNPVTITAAPGDTFTGNLTDTPYNEVSEEGQPDCRDTGNGGDICPGSATGFYVQLKDQFGNLVGADTNVTSTLPTGEGDTCPDDSAVYSSYNGQVSAGDENVCDVYSDGAPTTATQYTVTDTWDAAATTFKANPDAGDGNPAFVATVAQNDSTAKSASFTVDLYSVNLDKLTFSPPKITPAPIDKTGTTVHDALTVTDQYGNPVEGLFVTFDQSGPAAGVDQRADDFTDDTGTAVDNFSSSVQGDAKVTADVYAKCFDFTGTETGGEDEDCVGTTGGTPLDESVSTVSFDAVPTISVSPTTRNGKGDVKVKGMTRAGASVVLREKPSGASSYSTVGTKTAATDGSYSFTVSISKSATFHVVVDSIQQSANAKAKVKIIEKPTVKLSSSSKGKLKVSVNTSPNVKSADVHYYEVSSSGGHTYIGKSTTNSSGNTSKTFSLKAGKKYKIDVRVVGLGSDYDSEYSAGHSKTVHK